MAEETVVLGKVTSAFGVKGWIKVFSYTQPRLNILNYRPWLLKRDGKWQQVELIEGRQQGKTVAARLKGVNNRDEAEALSGTEIAVTSDQLPQLGEDEFYWRDLEGLRVVNTEQIDLGKVSHLIETGSNDVLVVNQVIEKEGGGKGKKERLIPYTPDAVVKVDKEAQQIIVEWDADF